MHKETKLQISWHAKHSLKSLNRSFFLKNISLFSYWSKLQRSHSFVLYADSENPPATRAHLPQTILNPLLISPPEHSDRHRWGFRPNSGSGLKLHACRTETGSRRRLASPNIATSKWNQLSSSPDAFTLVSEGLISGLIDWSFCRCLSSSLGTGPLTSTCRSFMFVYVFFLFVCLFFSYIFLYMDIFLF